MNVYIRINSLAKKNHQNKRIMKEESDIIFNFPSRNSEYSSIIVGIGGGASRIVDQMRKRCILDVGLVGLYAFGMNRKEMNELSLYNKYLIGQEGLGSGKNRFLAEYECNNSLPVIENILKNKLITVFVVCLGGGTGEGCIRSFLGKAKEMQSRAIILVATIPHSSEGKEKRKNALGLLKALEPMVDGLHIVDYDDFQCNTFTELFQKADRKIIQFTDAFVGMVLRYCLISFDFNDLRAFLEYPTPSKNINFFTLTGSVDFLRSELLEEWCKKLPAKYSSVDDVAMIIFAIEFTDRLDDSEEATELMNVINDFMQQISAGTMVKWGIYRDETIPSHQYRINIFTKCRRQ